MKIDGAIAALKQHKEEIMNEIRRHPTALNIATNVDFKINVVKKEHYPKHFDSHDVNTAYLTSKKYYERNKEQRETIARIMQQLEPKSIPKTKVLPEILKSSIKYPQKQKTEDLICERGKVLGGENGRNLPSQYHETSRWNSNRLKRLNDELKALQEADKDGRTQYSNEWVDRSRDSQFPGY